MTVADMSIIQAEVEVDETDVPTVSIGQLAKVTIDAVPDRTFKGHVAEIGNSPIQNTGTQGTTARQATNFKVVVVIDEPIPAGIRPGSSCTADITTAVRSKVLSVPIQSVTVRELVYDEAGKIVREPPTRRRRRPSSSDVVSAEELPQGQSRKETEGVFAFRAGKAEFVPVKVGIAGEKFFEVLSGLNQGDQVITGPYASVRQINDGDSVKLETPTRADRRP
jgi:HlyD family secretion protein